MRQFLTIDKRGFTPAWDGWLRKQAPEQISKAVNQVAYAVARIARAESPVGPPPNPYRAQLRSKYRNADYGPLKKAWRTAPLRGTTGVEGKPARVFNKAYYGWFVEFGTNASNKVTPMRRGPRKGVVRARFHPRPTRARPILAKILAQAPGAAEAVLQKLEAAK